ncbi:hypothetical protein [Massilia sp. TS11]|uniref:hypothetical protein n=1 Tax=Massilia sp. TS11 TaxID=2908003 RepID=UPI001EDC78DF|nr:hypothetical protein [Massilia sp. TS11]MCG2583680.1 hypothetical protein [Massilia sp. TS11]
MTFPFQKLSVGLIALGLSLSAWAGELYVITHPGVKVEAADVRDIFLGDKQIAGGTKLVPLDNAAAQKDFLAKVMSLDAGKYGTIWAKKGFREGLNPPPLKGGDADVLNAVKSTPGAVGYVTAKPAGGVNVVQKY